MSLPLRFFDNILLQAADRTKDLALFLCRNLEFVQCRDESFNPFVPVGFGDSEVLRVLRLLSSLAVPLVTMTEEPGKPPKAIFTRTEAAENVLRGEVDYLTVNEPDYWIGGVHISRGNVWRWDADRREIVAS